MGKVLAAVTVMLLAFSVAMAEEFSGIIKKVDGNKVTVTKVKKGEKGEDVTLTAADNVKVVKGKFNKETKKIEAGDAIEGGLKSEAVTKGGFARIVTEGDKITEIRITEKKKKDNK